MEIDTLAEILSFGSSIIIGVCIGILFDLYRSFRYSSKPKRILSYIEDLIFWIIVVIIFFMLLVKTTDGILRGFVFIGCFSGGLLYMLLLSKYFLSVFILIFKLIFGIISEIIRILIYPFLRITSFTKKRVDKIILIPKVFFKEMSRYRKIISRKK